MIGIGSNDDITLKLGTSTVSKAYWGTQQVYPNVTPPTPSGYETQYFTIEATSAGSLYFENNTTQFEYSMDNGSTWELTDENSPMYYDLGTRDKILFRCTSPTIDSTKGIGHFRSVGGGFKVYGNIMSLLYGSNFIGQTTFPYGNTDYYLFSNLFSNFTTLTDAENLVLPATTLIDYCYFGMFQRCTALTKVPELPATTMVNNGYRNMFYNCTALTTAPALPATTLANDCYYHMFDGCTSLTTAPSVLPATTLGEECYSGMFYGCTSLTTAPALPATTLVNSCYAYMFVSCTSLNYIKMMATNISASSCLSGWVIGVASRGTFVKNVNATWTTTGNNGIPSGWTVQTASE